MENFEYVEYGIKIFHLNKSWREVVQEARTMIAEEKEYVKISPISHKDFILDELNHIYSKILKFHVNATMLPSIEP